MLRQDWLIYLNVALIFAVVVYFWRGRSKDKTTRLNFGSKNGQVGAQILGQTLKTQAPHQPTERQLGVMFNFNGHQWEAYQVLGLPAGADLESCRQARDQLSAEDPSEIYRLAFDAISAHLRAHPRGE